MRGDPKGLGGKCLAHWSLECNGTIYEVGRKGAAWNPFNDLKFQWGPAKKVPFFHRELVGTTTKGHYDIRNKGKSSALIILSNTERRLCRGCLGPKS